MTTIEMPDLPDNHHDEIRSMAAYDVARHLKRHGMTLHEVVYLAGDPMALEAVETLMVEADAAFPDATTMAQSLDAVVDCLEGLSFELLDHLSRVSKGPADLLGAVNWHGAKANDFARRLHPS